MKIIKSLSFLLFFACASSNASTLERCNKIFYAKVPPIIENALLSKEIYELCFSGFAVSYSGISKTGLWSASLLTPESLKAAYQIKRNNTFHEEERIPFQHRSLLTDYRGSSFDRGHLSPSADRFTVQDQYESFSLVNMIPQSPHNNQEEWRLIEEALRAFVTRNNQPVYVITGPLFLGNKLRKIGNNVLVPSHIYKVVLFPKLNVAGAYVAINDESGRYDYVSINQLQLYSGIKFFPKASQSEIFNYRFILPVNSHEAVNMKSFRVASNNSSAIFFQLPKQGSENNPPISNQVNSMVKQNRSELVNLATDAAKSNVNLVSDWVRRILSK